MKMPSPNARPSPTLYLCNYCVRVKGAQCQTVALTLQNPAFLGGFSEKGRNLGSLRLSLRRLVGYGSAVVGCLVYKWKVVGSRLVEQSFFSDFLLK